MTTVNDISETINTAWRLKFKDITLYRYGSKTHQVLKKFGLESNINCD